MRTFTLSIIVPFYNEEKTIGTIVKRLINLHIPFIQTEIILVDDASTDGSKAIVDKLISGSMQSSRVSHEHNQGKGAAVRTGLTYATGDYVLIQDADLEYNPKYIPLLVSPVMEGVAEVVYGTRLKRLPNFKKDERTLLFFSHYVGNRLLSFITTLLYGQWLTDMETCYKLFPRKAFEGVKLQARGFELEPEITARLLKKGYRIKEVPISTNPRGYEDGKKLHTLRDGVKALWTLVKYRVAR